VVVHTALPDPLAAAVDAVEATAPRRLPLLAPVATWAGVTLRELGPFDEHGDPIDPPVHFRAL
jgi:hypothetical protein